MMLSKVKQIVVKNGGKKKNFVYYGSRNQNEEFCGVISVLYPNVFKIDLINGGVKVYSYNDLLIGNLKIVD